MSALLLAAAGAALYALGYAAHCIRPLQRLNIWAWDQVYRRSRELREGPAPRRPGWWAAQAVFAVEIAGLLVVHPRRTVRQWRHRNDPPPHRSPAVRITSYRCACGDQWPDATYGVGHTPTRCEPFDGAGITHPDAVTNQEGTAR